MVNRCGSAGYGLIDMNKIKSILFSESSLNLGGQELEILQQMQLLQEQGISVTLLAKEKSRIYQKAIDLNLPVVAISFRNSLDLLSIFKVCSIIRKKQIQFIITHSGKDAYVCGFAARLSWLKPKVIRVRTYQHGMPKAFVYNQLADLTWVPSLFMKSKLCVNPRIKPDNIKILYPGINFQKIKSQADLPLPHSLAQWLSEHPGPLITQIAMLRPEKGHLCMLQAIHQLASLFPNLRYVIAGEGAADYKLLLQERVHSLELEEHVFFAGLVDSIAPLLKKTTLLVMPSLAEPLGMSQIEALGLAIPVIGSDVDGIPETIIPLKTGLLVRPGDQKAWVDALRFALENPEKMLDMAKAGQQDVLSRFSAEAHIQSFLGYLEEIG
jgi:glycosyltransferase involved in cell wall biosynthesis